MNSIFTTWIFRANVFFLTLSFPFIFELTSLADESRFLRLAISSFLLAVIFLLPAINCSAILSKITREKFDLPEFFSVTVLFSILLVPLLLSLETDVFHMLSPKLPFFNTALSFVLFSFFFKSTRETPPQQSLIPETSSSVFFPYASSLSLSFLIVTATIVGIITAYYPLPDLDPYYWIGVFQNQFTQGVISSLTSYRPLFSSLAYLFNQSAGIDLYAFFKYIIPFFALLSLIPAILVARNFSEKIAQTTIFLIPIVNGSFFLYSTMPIPQSIFNSILIIALFLVLHALFSGKNIYFYLAGFTLFLGFFYHEMAALPLFAWILSLLIFERNSIISFATKNKVTSGLIFLLFITNIPLFLPVFSFLLVWIKKIGLIILSSSPNFYFPAKYINIDGNSVGWQGLFGVTQYYAFYFGPAAFLVLLSLFFLWHPLISSKLIRCKEFFFLLLSLLAFLLISDILPRFFNIALLPERSLGFVSLFTLSFFPILFFVSKNTKKFFPRLFPVFIFGALLINIGAALYINALKSYLITPAQLASANWIDTHLPANRVIFSSDNHRLLTFYSHSTVAGVSDLRFYSDKNITEKTLEHYTPKTPQNTPLIRSQLEKTADTLADLSNSSHLFNEDFHRALKKESEQLAHTIQLVEKELQILHSEKNTEKKYYIYHASPSTKNPYANRPYMQSENKQPSSFMFDQYPERFRMIYSDTENDIYLWEIL